MSDLGDHLYGEPDNELPALGRAMLGAALTGAAVGILAASAIGALIAVAGIAVDRARAA